MGKRLLIQLINFLPFLPKWQSVKLYCVDP